MARRVERRVERLTDPGEEEPSVGRRVATGCGIGCLGALLVAGAVGIGLGALERREIFGADDSVDEPARGAEPGEAGGSGAGDPAEPTPAPDDPAALRDAEARQEMVRRYRPGPFVTVDSMVPGGRLLPSTVPGTLPNGRTIDNPWAVLGAELRPGHAPRPAPEGPTVAHEQGERVDTPLTVLPRTPSRALVAARDAQGGTSVTAYLVEFEDYPGHFYVPAMVQTELGAVTAGGSDGATLHFTIQSPVLPDGRPLQPGQTMPVTMRIAAVDAAGRASAPITRPLSVMAVGAGDVEVTLTMGEATDLDLYVTDAAGQTVYFGNRDSFTGGHLDLDANAACGSNLGVDNEHVFWPAHRAPAGTYRVHVAHYESCIQGRALDYRVTVSACGETVVLSGRFPGAARAQVCAGPQPHDRAWCQEVVTFDIPPCATMR